MATRGEVICPSGRLNDGQAEMQSGQSHAMDGGKRNELDHLKDLDPEIC
jgi:hypothetical protein